MMKYTSEHEKNRAAQQQAEQKAEQDAQVPMSDARAQEVIEEMGCGGFFNAIETCLKGAVYIVCCCGCCTSWDDYINDTYD